MDSLFTIHDKYKPSLTDVRLFGLKQNNYPKISSSDLSKLLATNKIK